MAAEIIVVVKINVMTPNWIIVWLAATCELFSFTSLGPWITDSGSNWISGLKLNNPSCTGLKLTKLMMPQIRVIFFSFEFNSYKFKNPQYYFLIWCTTTSIGYWFKSFAYTHIMNSDFRPKTFGFVIWVCNKVSVSHLTGLEKARR